MHKARKSSYFKLIALFLFSSVVLSCGVTASTTITLNENSNAIPNENSARQASLKYSDLKKVGEAKFSFMFWDIYNSYLYTSTGLFSTVTNDLTVFRIQYLRDIDSDDLIDNTIEQWQHIGLKTESYDRYVPLLRELWPDIKRGDELALKIELDKSTFFLNGNYLGDIAEDKFGQTFIDIWLSKNTSQPELRRDLLGR